MSIMSIITSDLYKPIVSAVKAEATGEVVAGKGYAVDKAMGDYVAIEYNDSPSSWTRFKNWLFGSNGSAACGIGAEMMFDKARRGDAGVQDAGDGGPDADTGVCIDNDPPGTFSTNQPANGATGVSLRPTFGWTESVDPNSDTVIYELLISANQDMSDATNIPVGSVIEHTLVVPLLRNTEYFWTVRAKDVPCDAATDSMPTPPFSFTTLADCSTEPGSFDLVAPWDGNPSVSVTPTFDWTDALDIDPGDSVTYRFEIADNPQFTNKTVYDGLTDSTLTLSLAQALANGTTYYWRVVAIDDCGNEVANTLPAYYSFITEPVCIQQAIVETDFTSGILNNTDNEFINGSLILKKAWTCEWQASSGVLPENLSSPCNFTLVNTAGIVQLDQDPVTLLDALHLDSNGTNGFLMYQIDPAGISNSIGWVVEGEVRLVNSEATGEDLACGFEIRDFNGLQGRRFLLDIRSNLVRNVVDSGLEYSMTTTDASHTYRVVGANDDFSLEVDGATAIDGTNQMTFGVAQNRIYWGDVFDVPDSNSYWYAVRYFSGGTDVPYYSSGTYEGIYNLNSANNDLGSGAFISYNSNPLADPNVTIEVRSGNPTTPGDTCNDPITWLNSWTPILAGGVIGSSITPAQCLGVRVTENASSGQTVTPELLDFTINYCEG